MTNIAYTTLTDDDWVMAERLQGIGAQDGDYIDLTDVTEWHEDDPAPVYQAGTLYADAIRGANEMRRAEYLDRWISYGLGIHGIGARGRELTRGCPAAFSHTPR